MTWDDASAQCSGCPWRLRTVFSVSMTPLHSFQGVHDTSAQFSRCPRRLRTVFRLSMTPPHSFRVSMTQEQPLQIGEGSNVPQWMRSLWKHGEQNSSRSPVQNMLCDTYSCWLTISMLNKSRRRILLHKTTGLVASRIFNSNAMIWRHDTPCDVEKPHIHATVHLVASWVLGLKRTCCTILYMNAFPGATDLS